MEAPEKAIESFRLDFDVDIYITGSNAYLQFGGMPILRQFDFNTARVNEVLEGIYSTVILRDVLERNKATNPALLVKLVMFLADNIGNVTSPAEKPDEKLYIQVTETMAGEATRERELHPLRMINDNYEKIVLSMDKSFIKSYEGIKVINIIDFLLEKDSEKFLI